MDGAFVKYQQLDSKLQYVNGIHTWLKVMLLYFVAQLVITNYNEYGLLWDPKASLFNVDAILYDFGLLLLIAFSYFLIQILNAYLIETWLSTGSCIDSWGMLLHAVNAFSYPLFLWLVIVNGNFYRGLLFVLYNYTVNQVELNNINNLNMSAYAKTVISHTFMFPFKFWSYAMENRKMRLENKLKAKQDDKLLKYPKNVTINNLITYIIFTPPVLYQTEYPKRTLPNYKILLVAFVKGFILIYLVSFIFWQYINPEVFKLEKHIENKEYLLAVNVYLKLLLPVDIFWLLYGAIYIFKVYLPTYSELTGMHYIVYQLDWWNSYNNSLFWSKWNIPMYMFFKEYFFKPLLKNGYSKLTSIILVTCVSGLLHEFTFSIPYKAAYGLPFAFTMVQISNHLIEDHVFSRLPRKMYMILGNFMLWMYVSVVHVGGFLALHYAVYN